MIPRVIVGGSHHNTQSGYLLHDQWEPNQPTQKKIEDPLIREGSTHQNCEG